jgi:branched-chain amino acid transport system permease protein
MKRPLGPSWELAVLAVLVAYPLFPALEQQFFRHTGRSLGDQMPTLFIFALLALALNVVVGYVGLLHLGIAAFFGIGAYVTGILTVPANPFETGFWVALVAGAIVAALAGGLLGVPTLRLRGDYLALVTLGFGEVVKFTLRNLDPITNGTRGLNPVPTPAVPGLAPDDWLLDYKPFYYLCLAFLAVTVVLLRGLERSKLGRAWVAVREDELAAACMGLNVPRLKLAAFVFAAGIAGLAGCLYATKMTSTVAPDAYGFNTSIFLLCCVILGGIGSIRGVLLGVALLYSFDNILSPILDAFIQQAREAAGADLPKTWQTFTGWRLMVFGLVLILVMRFRPEGLIPSDRVREELHPEPHPGAVVSEGGA